MNPIKFSTKNVQFKALAPSPHQQFINAAMYKHSINIRKTRTDVHKKRILVKIKQFKNKTNQIFSQITTKLKF